MIPPPFLSLSTATQKSTPSSHIRRDFLVEWLGATAVLVHCPLENIYYTDHRQLSSLLCAPTLRLEGARGTTSASSDWSCLHFLLQVPCLPFMSAFCCICLFVMSCPVKLKCTRKLAGVSVTTIRFETHRFSLRTKATAHHRCATQELLR